MKAESFRPARGTASPVRARRSSPIAASVMSEDLSANPKFQAYIKAQRPTGPQAIAQPCRYSPAQCALKSSSDPAVFSMGALDNRELGEGGPSPFKQGPKNRRPQASAEQTSPQNAVAILPRCHRPFIPQVRAHHGGTTMWRSTPGPTSEKGMSRKPAFHCVVGTRVHHIRSRPRLHSPGERFPWHPALNGAKGPHALKRPCSRQIRPRTHSRLHRLLNAGLTTARLASKTESLRDGRAPETTTATPMMKKELAEKDSQIRALCPVVVPPAWDPGACPAASLSYLVSRLPLHILLEMYTLACRTPEPRVLKRPMSTPYPRVRFPLSYLSLVLHCAPRLKLTLIPPYPMAAAPTSIPHRALRTPCVNCAWRPDLLSRLRSCFRSTLWADRNLFSRA